MRWYQISAEETAKQTNSDPNKGLSTKEVQQRLKRDGRNEWKEEKSVSQLALFFGQFKDFMVLVLLAATVVSGLLGEYIDSIAILLIVVLNALIGFFQERNAEKSLSKLKELNAPMARVLRDGQWSRISSAELVAGDIVSLSAGDRVPADLRLIRVTSLETEESALTGESLPVAKVTEKLDADQLGPQDQQNIAFMSSLVTRGSGTGIVIGTGSNTVVGQIAELLVDTKRKQTPLEKRLEKLGKILIVIALLLTALTVLAGVYRGNPIYEMLIAGVSLAVAVIPEGLPAIVTVALSLGVQRMIKQKAIVRRLSAVETLGSATVICSDKTGTLTENQMTVKEIYLDGKTYTVTGDGYDPSGGFFRDGHDAKEESLHEFLRYGVLSSHAKVFRKKKRWMIDGDPTEGALVVAAKKAGIEEEKLSGYDILHEIPFDSKRKRMTVLVRTPDGKQIAITKGAPDVLIEKAAFLGIDKKLLAAKDKQNLYEAVDQMAAKALRTIAICIRQFPAGYDPKEDELEKDMSFIGLNGLIDPPRKEAKDAIIDCRKAGIKTIMITGDHVKTATAIANMLHILPPAGRAVEGKELDHMSNEELESEVDRMYVFARVTPEHKLRIVQALQKAGHIVAMTGDGVNDAPAIKASDIGISMGVTGTDVAKEASGLVLMDDNFATIKAAIKEGRTIYSNIRKFVRYLLASNVGEILVMLFAMILALPMPLVPIQILWVNLVTDGLPAIALGMDKAEDEVMKQKPRHPNEGIFARGLGTKIVTRGILIGSVTIIAFMLMYMGNPDRLVYAQTTAFATLVMAQLIHVFDCRSEKSVFARNPFGNMWLIGAVISSLVLLLAVIYVGPLQPIFHTTDLIMRDWLLILGLSAIPTVLFGFLKK
ncbi:cation-translocating P-type ATPase [Terribacillus saccharophilus]|uniref:cation-translocating P-type ATPase n=1 Tax=Terribacillus saccharophilus TaxID=361277 RepID=UPI003982C902